MALFADSAAERTERPTARRRRQARERGLVARSAELLSAARLLAIWAVLAWWVGSFVATASQWLRTNLQLQSLSNLRAANLPSLAGDFAWQFVANAGWPLVTASSAVLLAHFGQVGWLWRWENLAPRGSRLSPTSNASRWQPTVVSGRAFTAVAKLFLVAATYSTVMSYAEPLSVGFNSPRQSTLLNTLPHLGVNLASSIAVVYVAFGMADYLFQRRRLEQTLHMTPAELRQELKDIDGDPQIKRQRQIAAQQLQQSSRSALVIQDSRRDNTLRDDAST